MTNELLRIVPEREAVPDNQVFDLDIVVEINSTSVPQGQKHTKDVRDLNLCVVIDRSGSMAGDKIATAKTCCKEIVDRLSSNDLFCLVVFDHEAEVIVDPSTPHESIHAKIDSVDTRGNTNLALGWKLGLLQLQTFMRDSHVNRLMLLSDGQANQGETKPLVMGQDSAKAREIGITTSTIGIGKGYQEDILAALANESGGRFYNIQETQLEDIINAEFKGSLATRLERPRIALEFGEGTQVVDELNNLKKVSGKYRLRPILDNDIFQFAVRVRFSPEQFIDRQSFVRAVLYDGEGVVEQSEVEIPAKSYSEFVQSAENLIVKSVVGEYLTLKTQEEVIERFDAGQFDVMADLLVERIEGMLRVKDKLEVERELVKSIEEQAGFLREIGFNRKKAETNTYLKLIVEFMNYVSKLGRERLRDPNMVSFLQRFRKIMMFEHLENLHQRDRRNAIDLDDEMPIRRIKDENLREIFDDARSMLSELINLYPNDADLLTLNEQFNDLARSQ